MTTQELQDTAAAFAYKSDAELSRSHFLFRTMQSNFLVKLGPSMVNLALSLHLPIKGLLKKYLFDQFCGGLNLEDTQKVAKNLEKHGVYTLLDYAIEGESSEEGFNHTEQEFIKIIDFAKNQENNLAIAIKITGIGAFNILEKVQAGTANAEELKKFEKIKTRLDNICKKAFESNQSIYIDAEESWIQEVIDLMAEEMMQKYNQNSIIVYTTIQFYRHSRLPYLEKLLKDAQDRNYLVGVKIVRGAYMEKESARAKEKNYTNPIQPNKKATDADFNAAGKFILSHLDKMAVCIGTHNDESCILLANEMIEKNIALNHPHVVFAQLYGMSDNISFNLARLGLRAAKYLPFGPLEKVLPYLFRRANENTSIAGQTGREFKLVEKEHNRRKNSKLSPFKK